jgi:uncharacterized protein YjbI with pentapeptide repeats/uncharacterized protein
MSRHLAALLTILLASTLNLTFALLLENSGSAQPRSESVESTTSQVTAAPSVSRNALDVCAAITKPGALEAHGAKIDPRLQDPNIRIEGQDFSGQDLAGKGFRGKVLVKVNFKGTNLRQADFTDAVICDSDLTNANFTEARLDRAMIGGLATLGSTAATGANFTGVSGRALDIADAYGIIRIDGADLRGATIRCDAGDNLGLCMAQGVSFASVNGADLRGSTIDGLCCSSPGLSTARLDGVTTQFDASDGGSGFDQLATGVGEGGRITLIPEYGFSATKTVFTGSELKQLDGLLDRMRSMSAHPGFACSRARIGVEKAICADPMLAALDGGLSWLWQRVDHTAEEISAEKKWLAARENCSRAAQQMLVATPANWAIVNCIERAYAERIKELAPKSSRAFVVSGTYTPDPPIDLPQEKDAALAKKLLMVRGFRQDAITIENLGNGAGKISGFGIFSNGHVCSLEASEAEIKRVGWQFQIFDIPEKPSDEYSVSFAITPQVVVRVGGAIQFQCGARGGWSEFYFRQPETLIAKIKGLRGAREAP